MTLPPCPRRSPPVLMQDLVEEILLRLPPDEPARRVHAALICKSWLRILHDGAFLRRYPKFHRKPSLLGFIHNGPSLMSPGFFSTSIAFHFSLPAVAPGRSWVALDCRHHRVLLILHIYKPRELIVWDPITHEQHHLPLPSHPHSYSNGAVLCAADGCDHLDCHGGPYLVVFVGTRNYGLAGGKNDAWVSVYSSETGAWSAVTSTTIENGSNGEMMKPSLLIGDKLYFSLSQNDDMHMLKFDLGGRTLSVIETPGVFGAIPMMAEDGGLEFVAVLHDSIYSWSWQAGTHGNSARWVRQWMMDLVPLVPICHRKTMREVIGLVEGTQTIFIYSPRVGIFTLDLNSRQVKKLGRGGFYYNILPYSSFYIPDLAKGRLALP
ncbi:hypothetical protein EJB05_14194, partial [Eragrostis curvula]